MPDEQPTLEVDTPPAATYTPPATQADLDKIVQDRLARERAKTADYKDLKAKADQFDALQEASKTELEKLTERATKGEKLTLAETQRADRAEVALEKGLTPTQAKRLVGNTRDEMLADADLLLADLGEKGKTPPRAASQKTTTDTAPGEDAEREFARRLFGGAD